ncbi:MAG TPA: MATE family efflux transporter [Oscillospiraceae bacterium]|nr:MATE family efflux transporter [Oscillospiraceae bacterium]HRW57551.1 MATE family efflux transporter [Oscillospiraceae bacterium]
MYDKKEIARQVLAFGIPVALHNFVNVAVNMLDTIMVGRLGGLQLAAVNQCNQLYLFYTMFIWGICMGAATLSARYWGKGETKPIRDLIGLTVQISATVGVLLSAVILIFPHFVMRIFASDPEVIRYGVEYLKVIGWAYIFPAFTLTYLSNLRAVGNVKVSLMVSLASCFINGFLNWILIYGKLGAPRLEVRGAAIATAISKAFELLVVLAYMYFKEKDVGFTLKSIFVNTKPYLPSFVKFGIPVFFSEFIWGIGMTVQSAVLGQYDAEFLAAYSLVLVVGDLSTVFMCGFANADMVILGNMLGAGRDEEVKKLARSFTYIGLALGAVMAGIVLALRPFAPDFIVSTEKTKEYIRIMMLIVAYVVFCYGSSWNLSAGVLRAGGDTAFCAKVDTYVTLIMKCGIGAFLGLVLRLPVLIVYFVMCSEDLVKGILLLIRYLKGNWLHHGLTIPQSQIEAVEP